MPKRIWSRIIKRLLVPSSRLDPRYILNLNIPAFKLWCTSTCSNIWRVITNRASQDYRSCFTFLSINSLSRFNIAIAPLCWWLTQPSSSAAGSAIMRAYYLARAVSLFLDALWRRCGRCWLEKPGQLYGSCVLTRARCGSLQLSLPGHSLHNPLISELYYSITWWPSRLPSTDARGAPPKIHPHVSSTAAARAASWFYLLCTCALHFRARKRQLTFNVITTGYRLMPGAARVLLEATFGTEMTARFSTTTKREREKGVAARERWIDLLPVRPVVAEQNDASRQTWKKARRNKQLYAKWLATACGRKLARLWEKRFPPADDTRIVRELH